jgi:hypothetical protein
MSREYEQSKLIEGIAKRFIKEHHPHLKNASIGYLMHQKDPEKNTPVRGDSRIGIMEKIAKVYSVPEKYRMLTGFNYMIEVDEVYWDFLELKQQEAIIDHELCHIASDEDGLYIRDHDVEEFAQILVRHGFWNANIDQSGTTVFAI